MADEIVGSAYVIIRAITNKIRDDIRDGVKKGAGDPALEKAGERIGNVVGDTAGEHASERIVNNISETPTRRRSELETAGTKIGDKIGETAGKSIASKISEGVRTSVRETTSSNDIDRAGHSIGTSIFNGILESPLKKISRKFSSIFAGSEGTAAATAAGGRIGATIGAAIGRGIPTKLFFGPALIPLANVALRVLESYVSSAIAILAQMGPALAGVGISGAGAMLSIYQGVGAVTLALKTQSPLLTAFQKKMDGIKSKFEDLGRAIQKTLLPRLGDALEKIANNLLPVLTKHLSATGTVVANLASRFARLTSQDFFKAQFGKVLGNNNYLLGKLGNGLINIVDAFVTLYAAARPVLRVFGEWFVRLTQTTRAALRAGEASGGLARWMKNAARVMRQWGAIIGNFGKAFGNVLSIAAGEGETLTRGLRKLSKRFLEFTRSADGENKIRTWFQNGIEIMRAFNKLLGAIFKAMFGNQSDTSPVVSFIESLTTMVPTLEKLFGVFNKMLPSLTRLSEAFAGFLDAMVESGALDAIVATMTAFYNILSAVLSIPGMGAFVGYLLAILAASKALNLLSFGLFSKGLALIGKNLGQAAGKAGLLTKAKIALKGAVKGLISGVAKLGKLLGGALLKGITGLARSIGGVVSGFARLAGVLGKGLVKGLGVIMRLFGGLLRVFGSLIGTLIRLGAAWLVGLGPIGWIIIGIVALVAAFVVAYKKSEKFREIVHAALNAVKNAFVTVFNTIKTVVMFVFNLLVTIFTTYFNIYKTIVTTVFNAIRTVVTVVWNAIRAVISTVLNVIRTIIVTVWNTIRAATSAVWGAIRAVVSTVANAIRSVVSNVFNGIRSVVSGVWNAIKSATSAAWNAIKSVVSNAVNGVMDKVRGLKDRVIGFFSGAAGWLTDAGKSIIKGLISGITSMAGAVGDAVKGVLKGARDLLPFSPAKKGPFSGKGWTLHSGRAISRALAQGITDDGGRAVAAARTMVTGVSKAISSGTGSAMRAGVLDRVSANISRPAFAGAGGAGNTQGGTGDTVTNTSTRSLTVVNNYPKPESADGALFRTAQNIAHLGLVN